MVSVIILTYNQEATIRRAIDSVLAQNLDEPLEILLGDDASTDSTPAICREYAERFPDVVSLHLNSENRGLVDNYFDCLLLCKGDLVADCAGDDYWCDTEKLQKELQIMRQNPDVTLVHTDWMTRNESTGELAKPAFPPQFPAPFTDGKTMLEAIITQRFRPVVQLCTALYRKSVFLEEYEHHRELFRSAELGCEDLQLVFVMALHGKVAFLPDVTLHYTVGEGSISNNDGDSARQFRFVRRVTGLSHKLSTLFSVSSENTERYFQQRIYELLMHAFRASSRPLRDEALALQREWKVRSSWPIRRVRIVTSCAPVWRAALCLRSFLRS